jgi:hypothetical protein
MNNLNDLTNALEKFLTDITNYVTTNQHGITDIL